MTLLKENKAQLSFSYLLVILGLLSVSVIAMMVLTGALNIQSEAIEEQTGEATSSIGDSKPGAGLQLRNQCDTLCDTKACQGAYSTTTDCTSDCVSDGRYDDTTNSISGFSCP